jgi:hypothetical protein
MLLLLRPTLPGRCWCPYSRSLLKAIADKEFKAKIDLIAFHDDELDDAAWVFSSGGWSLDKVTDWVAEQREDGRLFADAEDIEYALSYYFIQKDIFPLSAIGGFPTLLRCDPDGCSDVSQELPTSSVSSRLRDLIDNNCSDCKVKK